jgi:hypothetical protein
VNEEAWKGQTVEGQCDLTEGIDTIMGLARLYSWWMPRSAEEEKKNVTRDGEIPM